MKNIIKVIPSIKKSVRRFLLILIGSWSAMIRLASGQTFNAGVSPTMNGQNRAFLPPSPAASSLGMFGKIPVSPYTGLPDVRIPLYTIKALDISLPIEIQYHGGANKPDMMPGPVGMGWAISVGSITRVINGQPDEFGSIAGIGPGDTRLALLVNGWDNSTKSLTRYLQNNVNNDSRTGTDAYLNPDEYDFNFSGMSGRFYFDNTGKFRIKSSDDVQLSITSQVVTNKTFFMPNLPQTEDCSCTSPYTGQFLKQSMIYSFTITDKLGIQYTFGGTDNSIEFSRPGAFTLMSPQGQSDEHILPSTWNLTQIKSPHGPAIILYYTRGDISVTEQGYTDVFTYSGAPGNDFNYPAAPVVRAVNAYMVNQSILRSIIAYGQTVEFETSIASSQLDYPTSDKFDANNNIRFDAYNDIVRAKTTQRFPYKIDKITISDNLLTNAVRKSITFNYTTSTSERMKLLSINLLGGDNSRINFPKYTFQYNTTHLPPYLAFQSDRYGFYNNKYIALDENTLINTLPATFDAYKNPDPNYSSAEILTGITYPTGGSTSFKWEQNDYGTKYQTWPFITLPNSPAANIITGGSRIAQILNYDKSGALLSSKKYHYVANFQIGGTNSSGVLSYFPIFYESLSGPLTPPLYVDAQKNYTPGTLNFL